MDPNAKPNADGGSGGNNEGNPNPDLNALQPPGDGGEDLETKISKRVAEELKEIKAKLDTAYGARDEAAKKVKEYEAKERQAEIERLKADGKTREAYDAQLADATAQIESLKKKNIELSRDVQLNGLLATLPFKNDMARTTAFRLLSDNLTQNDKDEWVHKDGTGLADYVKAFSSSEETSFLFKQPVSSGTGSGGDGKPSAVIERGNSLFKMSQAEVLKQVEDGRIVAPRG
jgi:hypothetical protein